MGVEPVRRAQGLSEELLVWLPGAQALPAFPENKLLLA